MNCKHDVNSLMGTGDGIVCRKCGKIFTSFATLKAELDADRAAQEQPKPEADHAPTPEPEKPKRGRKKKEA